MSDLAWAVKNGDLDQVKELVEAKVGPIVPGIILTNHTGILQGVDINQQIDGRLPLHYASDYGQLEVLKFLCSKGAQINAADKHGISPLLAAIWEGHTSCVQFLLEKGASKSGTAPDGSSYVEAAEKDEIKALLR
eukprot:GFUD01042208.1.p1 GENE.GFUD01042208.1~~GFUD01042208.1.p1  ORF type:complete len:135 (+),score=48.03 GFUD01042208.1:211-615(+)